MNFFFCSQKIRRCISCKSSVFFSSPLLLVGLYQHAQHSLQCLSVYPSVKQNCQSMSDPFSAVITYQQLSMFNSAYTWNTYTHKFHAITCTYENRMKIMRISCEKVMHVYHVKKIYNVHVKIMRLSYDFRIYKILLYISCDYHVIIMRLSCESWKTNENLS